MNERETEWENDKVGAVKWTATVVSQMATETGRLLIATTTTAATNMAPCALGTAAICQPATTTTTTTTTVTKTARVWHREWKKVHQ